MYKVGEKASRTSQLPASIARKASLSLTQRTSLVLKNKTPPTSLCNTPNLGSLGFFTSGDIHLPIRNKKKTVSISTPPTTPSSPLLEQQIVFLTNSWKAFRETPTGEPDKKIVEYRAEKSPSEEDFTPFNMDRYLMEKLLREVNIDPKILQL